MPSSRLFVFTDLDDTLIQTERKLPEGASFKTGAYDREGKALSFFTQSQQALLAMFEKAEASIIPITGRNKDALDRVDYPFSDYAAVSHGAVVLQPNGQLCPRWQTRLEADGEDWPGHLQRLNEQVWQAIKVAQLDARSRVIIDQEIHAYVSVKGTEAALDQLQPLLQECTDSLAMRLHRNGRNAALLPPYTCKQKATSHIAEVFDLSPDDLVIGLGDSLSDLPFMRRCDFALFPTGSQIDQQLEAQ